MRITDKMIADGAGNDLQRALARLLGVQEKLSSGKRVNRPSDDPFATHRAISSRGSILVLEQFRRNISEIKGWVSATDQTLMRVNDLLRDARTLAIQAANGYLTASDRENIALRIDEMREGLLQASQEKFAGRYIFSGTRTGDKPFTWTGSEVEYNGNDTHMTVNLGPGAELTFNLTGDEVFVDVASGESVFGLLYSLAQAVRAGETTEVGGALLGRLDDVMDRVTEKLGIVGAAYDRLENMDSVLSEVIERERGLLSEAEDVDLAEAVMDLSMQQTAYQASLAASAKVILPTLLDYLG